MRSRPLRSLAAWQYHSTGLVPGWQYHSTSCTGVVFDLARYDGTRSESVVLRQEDTTRSEPVWCCVLCRCVLRQYDATRTHYCCVSTALRAYIAVPGGYGAMRSGLGCYQVGVRDL
eukprot:3933258-Rhodomonas_salina.2